MRGLRLADRFMPRIAAASMLQMVKTGFAAARPRITTNFRRSWEGAVHGGTPEITKVVFRRVPRYSAAGAIRRSDTRRHRRPTHLGPELGTGPGRVSHSLRCRPLDTDTDDRRRIGDVLLDHESHRGHHLLFRRHSVRSGRKRESAIQ